MNESFDIYDDFLSGLTAYTFDISVLKRVALECGVAEVKEYSELTEEQKDRCKIGLLETLLLTPYQSASQTDRHGEWHTQTGAQTLSAANIERVKNEIKGLYKKYGEEEKLESLENADANLEWME